MSQIKISVIVPVYNAEKFLSKGLDALIAVKTSALEIILVDDGSTDNSGIICDQYADRDRRIKVVHKVNGGISTARNAGINVATGTHISFLDADDYFDKELFFDLIPVITQYDPDCIDFGYKYINDFQEVTYNMHGMPKMCLFNRHVIKEKILPPLLNLTDSKQNFIFDFSVNKIYKSSILTKYGIRFNEQRRTWEDRLFVVEYLGRCNTFYSMDKCYYNYVSVPNSLSRQFTLAYFDIIIENYKYYAEKFGAQYNFNTQYVWNYWSKAIENMIQRAIKECENKVALKKKVMEILTDEIVRNWFIKRKPNNLYQVINKIVIRKKIGGLVYYNTQFYLGYLQFKSMGSKTKSFLIRCINYIKRKIKSYK